MTSVARLKRFSKAAPCPICNGHPGMARGKHIRCAGYLSGDGMWAYCAREEHAVTGQEWADKAAVPVHKWTRDADAPKGWRPWMEATPQRSGYGTPHRDAPAPRAAPNGHAPADDDDTESVGVDSDTTPPPPAPTEPVARHREAKLDEALAEHRRHAAAATPALPAGAAVKQDLDEAVRRGDADGAADAAKALSAAAEDTGAAPDEPPAGKGDASKPASAGPAEAEKKNPTPEYLVARAVPGPDGSPPPSVLEDKTWRSGDRCRAFACYAPDALRRGEDGVLRPVYGALRGVHRRFDYADGRPKCTPWDFPDGVKVPADTMLYRATGWESVMDSALVVEGEKAAEALAPQAAALGWAVYATVGAGTIPTDETLRAYLGHYQTIALWPDNDNAGRKQMTTIAEALIELFGRKPGRKITGIVWPDAAEKGDAADWAEAEGDDPEALAALLAAAPVLVEAPPPAPVTLVTYTGETYEELTEHGPATYERTVETTGAPPEVGPWDLGPAPWIPPEKAPAPDWTAEPAAEVTRRKLEEPTGEDLLTLEMPKVRWVVPDLLPQGLTVFGGPGKIGKSWLCMQVGVALSSAGVVLGKFPVDRGDVLYLSLEDTTDSLTERLEQLMANDPGLTKASVRRLHLRPRWPKLDDGGLKKLDDCLATHPRTRLVIVDTWIKVRQWQNPKANVYALDSQHLSDLKALAEKYDIAIVAVHHLNKTTWEDPYDAFSGSTGITGTADTLMVMKRPGRGATATLQMTGRRVKDRTLALRFDETTCMWTYEGEGPPLSDERQAIRDAFEPGETLNAKDVASRVAENYEATRKTIMRMVKDGQLVNAGKEGYRLPDATTA